MVKNIIRLENLALLFLSVYFYKEQGGSIFLFIFLVLSPDVSLLGYLINQQIGAIAYNAVHNLALAISIIFIGIIFQNHFLALFGLILSTHVSADRFLGFGLKYPRRFKETHIQKL